MADEDIRRNKYFNFKLGEKERGYRSFSFSPRLFLSVNVYLTNVM